jgi:hypothetical protein
MRLRRREEREAVVLQHGEAFALMKYQNKVTGRVEWLWNSRDGVTPFLIDDPLCPEGHRERYRQRQANKNFDPRKEPDPGLLAHADWHEDAFVPNFVPTEGTRMFMSWSDAPPAYREAVGERWTAYVAEVKASGDVSAEHIAGLLLGEPYDMKPESPCVIVVTEELVARFHKLAAESPFIPAQAPATRPALITPDSPDFGKFTDPLKL